MTNQRYWACKYCHWMKYKDCPDPKKKILENCESYDLEKKEWSYFYYAGDK